VKEYRYTIFFEPTPEGGYDVLVPAIPEIGAFGETLDEAREMATDAIRCFLESAMETGERLREDVVQDQPACPSQAARFAAQST